MKIIPVKLEDYRECASVFVEAFQDDPIFKYVFETKEKYFRIAPWVFGSWIKWSIQYGEAWMTEDKKGVLIMRSLDSSEMSLWSMIKAGMLPTPAKMGLKTFIRFYFNMAQVLEKKNKEIMGKRKHWYGWMVGVKPDSKGIGKGLLYYALKLADQRQLPIYLETATAQNVSMYHYLGFHTADEMSVKKAGVNLYFMVRDPKTQKP